ncbi:substrate-binding periplasmic protein [Thalassotalea piscium]
MANAFSLMKSFTFLLLFLLQAFSLHASEYHFAAIDKLAEQEVGKIILTEIYKELGIKITISSLPGNRAEYEANQGVKDGEIMRIFSYGEVNENLIRVPTPYYYLLTTAFIKKGSKIELHTKDDLAQYRLARVRGVKHTKIITMNMPNVVEANSTIKMFKLLDQNIVDIALTNADNGIWNLAQTSLNDKITAYPRVFARLNLYHYIHKKNKHLVDKVNTKINEMIASGALKNIVQQARQQVFSNVNLTFDTNK